LRAVEVVTFIPDKYRSTTVFTTTMGGKGAHAGKPSRCSALQKFLYDSETGEILGRTVLSWVKVAIFYTIFYGALFGYFILAIYLFTLTLSPDSPTYQQGSSEIGTIPGLGYRPVPNWDQDSSLNIIQFSKTKTSYSYWTDQLKKIIKDASQSGSDKCGPGKDKASASQSCKVKLDGLGDCGGGEFGYDAGAPCVLIKLNRIYGWEPRSYLSAKDAASFKLQEYLDAMKTNDVPQKFIDTVRKEFAKNSTPEQQFELSKTIWINCNVDNSNVTTMTLPMPGIPSYYFPYLRQKDFVSPFVMVHFQNVPAGVALSVECKAYGGNVHPDLYAGVGLATFQLQLDK